MGACGLVFQVLPVGPVVYCTRSTQSVKTANRSCADVINLLSNQPDDCITIERIRRLTSVDTSKRHQSDVEMPPDQYQPHSLAKRLSGDQIEDAVRRYRGGESANSIAASYCVSGSAIVRLLREQGVVVTKKVVSPALAAVLASEYTSGATMAELEKRHGLSHGAVWRTLKREGVKTHGHTLRDPTASRHVETPANESSPGFRRASFGGRSATQLEHQSMEPCQATSTST